MQNCRYLTFDFQIIQWMSINQRCLLFMNAVGEFKWQKFSEICSRPEPKPHRPIRLQYKLNNEQNNSGIFMQCPCLCPCKCVIISLPSCLQSRRSGQVRCPLSGVWWRRGDRPSHNSIRTPAVSSQLSRHQHQCSTPEVRDSDRDNTGQWSQWSCRYRSTVSATRTPRCRAGTCQET